MKRRDFSRIAVLGATVVTGLGLNGTAMAQAAKPVAGRDYQELGRALPQDVPADKVEVLEFFSYMCPHCNEFLPTFEAWAKQAPRHIVVRRVPVNFLPNSEVLQRLYYALDAMNLVDRLHGKVFVAVHQEHYTFGNSQAAADWVAKQGVDRNKFVEQYNSFSVASKAQRAGQLTSEYEIDGVPTIAVGGRYKTNGTASGLRVAEALAESLRGKR